MVAREVGTVSILAGTPDRLDKQYAVYVNGKGLVVLGDWGQVDGFDNEDHPTIFEEPELAERARRSVELEYERLGVPHGVYVVEREIRTYIGEWMQDNYDPASTSGKMPVDLGR